MRSSGCRSFIFALLRRDFVAETDNPAITAISLMDPSCDRRISVTLRRRGDSLWIACPTRNCISMQRKFSSGLFDGSVISSGLRRLASSQSSRDASRCHLLFLSIIKAELMAIRVNQVENADLPSKVLMWTKAFSSVSWITSSVSWLFLVIRCTIWNIRGRYRSHNSAYAQFPPFCAVATRNSSLAVFIGVAHEELGRE